MKIKFIIYSLLLIISNSANSQNQFGQFTISAGASYSAFRGIHKLSFLEYEKDFDFTVGQQLHFDVALIRRFSVGVGYTHQKHVLNIYNFKYFSGPEIITENVVQTTNVHALYLRALVHHHNIYEDSAEELDLYAGLQQNLLLMNSRDDSSSPYFPRSTGGGGITIPSAVVGLRYYPLMKFGVHAEVSVPGAYTFSLGIVFRNFGRDKFLKSTFWS